MQQFTYKAIDTDNRIVTGVFDGENEKSAVRKLRKQGLNVLALNKTTKNISKQKKVNKKPSQKELLIVMHQLATLLKSGLTLEDATSSVADFNNNMFIAESFNSIRSSIRQGVSFSQSFRDCKIELPLYFYPLLESGELTGHLASSLRDGVRQWKEEQKITSEMRHALTYPFILILTGFISVMLIFATVVPKFSNLLAKGNADIPFLAVLVLGVGNFVNENFLFFAVGIGGAIVIGIYLAKDKKNRDYVQNILAQLPVTKDLLLETVLCQWASMLSTLLGNKVTLDKALEFSEQCININVISAPMRQVSRGVRGGNTLSESLRDANLVDTTGFNLIRVGEQSGNLADMLRSFADILSESSQNRTKQFLALIEPIAILAIGATVGVIMAGIILAITSVNDIAIWIRPRKYGTLSSCQSM